MLDRVARSSAACRVPSARSSRAWQTACSPSTASGRRRLRTLHRPGRRSRPLPAPQRRWRRLRGSAAGRCMPPGGRRAEGPGRWAPSGAGRGMPSPEMATITVDTARDVSTTATSQGHQRTLPITRDASGDVIVAAIMSSNLVAGREPAQYQSARIGALPAKTCIAHETNDSPKTSIAPVICCCCCFDVLEERTAIPSRHPPIP